MNIGEEKCEQKRNERMKEYIIKKNVSNILLVRFTYIREEFCRSKTNEAKKRKKN